MTAESALNSSQPWFLRSTDKGIIDSSAIFFVTDNDWEYLHFQSRFMARPMLSYSAIFTVNKNISRWSSSFSAAAANADSLKWTRILPWLQRFTTKDF